MCTDGGEVFQPNAVMVPDEDCSYICTCHVSDVFSGLLCKPLCPRPLDWLECGEGWEEKVEHVPEGPPEFGCVCEYHECVESEPALHVFSWLRRRSVR